MRVLSRKEINCILSDGKLLSGCEMTTILDEFENEQPEFYHAIYGRFSESIAEKNRDMANLFLDLCFDIIWIYRKAFGKPPILENGEEWMINAMSLLDAELKSLSENSPMNESLKSNLRTRLVKRSRDSAIQMEILEYLESEVIKYASFKKARLAASEATNNFLFVVTRIMAELYCRKEL